MRTVTEKGKVMKQTTTKIMLMYLIAAAGVLSAVRFFQYMSLVEFSTGYFFEGAETGGLLIYILMAVFAAAFAAAAVIAKKKENTAFSVSSDGMGNNATRVLGFSEVIGGGLILIPVLEESFTVQSIGMIVAAAAFIVSGFTLLGHIVPPVYTGHLKILCAVYMLLRTMNMFGSDLTIINHSDNLITLIAYVFATAFAASVARFYSRSETKNSRTREIVTAGLAFITASVHVIPKLLAYAFGGSVTAGMGGINCDIAATAVMTAAFLVIVFCTKKTKDIIPLAEEEDGGKKKKAKKTENA